MEISINNQRKQINDRDNFTVQQLVQTAHRGSQQGIAVAINNRVVARSLWDQTILQDQDQVLIIKASHGG